MKKDALISIKGLQRTDDPDSEEVTLVTEGRFYRKGNSYHIKYEESELTGFADTTTLVSVKPNVVTVNRTGKHPSMMTFEKGQRHMSLYNTQFGSLTITMATKNIESNLSDNGGKLVVEYDIEVQHAWLSTNTLSIEVECKGPDLDEK
ncbi:MAG: DUF1934 domain-containing protein [Clostridia bacterium]|nr:DUF1934 domain-containing protein [Clostridia bacterium]MBQ2326146.1 DUF1934 domain-containing protein [Clostridia bacterium]